MAYEESLKSVSLDADATVALYTGVPGLPGSAVPNSGHQYKFVKITGRHQVGLAVADGPAVGVLQNKPQVTGQAATVGFIGISTVRTGGAVAAGAAVSSDASGRAVTAGSGAKLGVAIEASTGADELIAILLTI